MNIGKTIIVSDRLPVKVETEGDRIVYRNSEGGAATGLSCIYKDADSLWIGWPGVPTKNIQLHSRIDTELRKRRLVPVMLSTQEIADFYEGFSNGTLWPLFHYFPTYAHFDSDQWETYVKVNRKFAEAIIEVAHEEDTIWIHDYHLLLVPSMVREQLPNATIGFFQHIPFPSYEIFRLLPWRNDLLKGLLGADLIGFHTQDDVDHFVESIQHIPDTEPMEILALSDEILVDDRMVNVAAFPMGVDFEKYRDLSCCAGSRRAAGYIRELAGDQKLMISIDRLDYSKGILNRLRSYDRFLAEHPEFHEKVVFLQLIVPSRDTVQQYGVLKEDINRMVTDINTRYSTLGWEPIRYFYRSLSPEALSGMYIAADVALVTPLRDGMNLVSKEFVASKTDSTGVLILSEMAGASRELHQALIINPNNEQELSDAIYKALTMPVREQVRRMKAMQRTVAQHNVHRWTSGFLNLLQEVKILQRIFDTHIYSEEIGTHILNQFSARSDAPRLLANLGMTSSGTLGDAPMAV